MRNENIFLLSELVEFKTGINLSRGTVNIPNDRIYTNDNLEEDLVSKNISFCRKASEPNPVSLQEGNIVINLATGKASIVSLKNKNKTIKNVFVCCRIYDNVNVLDSRYFCYFINESKAFEKAKNSGLVGGTMKVLSIKDLQSLLIKLPPIELQQKIGDFYVKLCRYNFLNREKQKLITLLLIDHLNKTLKED